MTLLLKVTRYKGGPPPYPLSFSFERGNASFGRLDQNDWVLPDPEKFLSGQHATLREQNGVYFLHDTSSNGVFVNNTNQPLGRGNQTQLRHGDRLFLGEYEIEVGIQGGSVPTPQAPVIDDVLHPGGAPTDPFADLGGPSKHQPGLQEDGSLTAWERSLASERPTMEILPAKQEPIDSIPHDHSASLHDAFADSATPAATPSSSSPLPENWFGDEADADKLKHSAAEISPPVSPAQDDPDATAQIDASAYLHPEQLAAPGIDPPEIAHQPEPTPVELEPPPAPVSQEATRPTRAASPPTSGSSGEWEVALDLFLKHAGINDQIDRAELGPETFALVGQLFRASIEGVREVILARSQLKNEMRLDVTTIRSSGNNPIKFSLTTEDAIGRLLSANQPGYMPPKDAVDEVVNDLKAHQIAMLAGMQTAMRTILARFEPSLLETRLQKLNPLSAKVPLQKQAKLWKLFGELYEQIESEATEDFNHLFGQAFGKAYEKQVWKLRAEHQKRKPAK